MNQQSKSDYEASKGFETKPLFGRLEGREGRALGVGNFG